MLSNTTGNKTEDLSLCKSFKRKNDLTALDYMVFPIYRSAARHWVVATVDVNKHAILVYDPLHDHQEDCRIEAKMIKCYLKEVAVVMGHCDFFDDFKMLIDSSHPKQEQCQLWCLLLTICAKTNSRTERQYQ